MDNLVYDFLDCDSELTQTVFGTSDENLELIREFYCVNYEVRNSALYIDSKEHVEAIKQVIIELIKLYQQSNSIEPQDVIALINNNFFKKFIINGVGNKKFYLRTKGQNELYESFQNKVITFAIGPAGTGKTFLAVVYACNLLREGSIRKIVITRPVVESGESLGFLPGDLREKVDPYLRPIYDALEIILGLENMQKYMEKGIIEIAPLAYMRGRTLNDACIILDEAQNTTTMQIKMFMTRLGFNSKMIITGDATQIDLPANKPSGLIEASKIVKGIDEIAIIRLHKNDVVRHPVVSKIIEAYEKVQK